VVEAVRNISLLSTIFELYSEMSLSLKPFGIGHMYIYAFLCLEWPILWPPRVFTFHPRTACTHIYYIVVIGKIAIFGPQPSLDSARFVYSRELDHPVFTSLDLATKILFLHRMVVSLASISQPGGLSPYIYVLQWQGDPVVTLSREFPFRHLLRLWGLWCRYSNSPPHRIYS
jgi:hypothetical protein